MIKMIIPLLCIALIILSGCASQAISTNNPETAYDDRTQVPVIDINDINETDNLGRQLAQLTPSNRPPTPPTPGLIPPPPPAMLNFTEGFNSIYALFDVLESDDDEIDRYLDYNSFSMNGLATRSNIESLLSTLSVVTFPFLDGLNPLGISVFPIQSTIHDPEPEWSRLTIVYELADNLLYSFDIPLEPLNASEHINIMQSDGELSKEVIAVIGGVYVYEFEISGMDETRDFVFAMDANGTFVNVRVYLSSGLTHDIVIEGLLGFELRRLNFAE